MLHRVYIETRRKAKPASLLIDFFLHTATCVFPCVLPGASGLRDPCETGIVDASAKLTAQERANITLSAQVRNEWCRRVSSFGPRG